jgi:ribosomal protein L24
MSIKKNDLVYIPNGKYKGTVLKITGISSNNGSDNKLYNTEETGIYNVKILNDEFIDRVGSAYLDESLNHLNIHSSNLQKLSVRDKLNKKYTFYLDNSYRSRDRLYYKATGDESYALGYNGKPTDFTYEFKITNKINKNGIPNFNSAVQVSINKDELKRLKLLN